MFSLLLYAYKEMLHFSTSFITRKKTIYFDDIKKKNKKENALLSVSQN